MLAGLGIWIVKGLGADVEGSPSPAGLDERSSLMESRGTGSAETQAESEAVSPVSPVAFRLGAGYLGGFFLGWALRKFITLTLLAVGALVALLALFQGLGWFEVNWSAVDEHLEMSLGWVHGQAGSLKTFVTGYLPGAGAATAGLFVGFRRG